MHPVIRIFCILCLAGLLARPSALVLLVCGFLVATAALVVRVPPMRIIRVVLRLRYLLLVILLLYGWTLPGDPLIPWAGRWSPAVQGLMAGGMHILALIVLVAGVQVLLISTPRGSLVAALRWWFYPLRLIGLSADRSALRLVLVMEAVPRISDLVRDQLERRRTGLRGWGELPGIAGDLFEEVLADADRMQPGPVQVPVLQPPAHWQWLIPGLFVVALVLVR